MARGDARAASMPLFVRLALVLVVVAALVLLAAPLGYRLGVIPLRTALLTVLRWGAYAALLAAGASALALGMQAARPQGSRRGLVLAAVCLLLAGAMAYIPVGYTVGSPTPSIHDITTDTQDPPQFVAVVPLNTPDRTVYEGEVIAAQQREAYPDLEPVRLAAPPAQAFEQALAAVYAMRWQLVEADAPGGRIEATDTTFWFGFKDDVVIRVRPDGGGSRIDVRSLSRVGGGDAGTNAARIRDYIETLTAD